MLSNNSIYNWLAILGIGYVRWQSLQKQWQELRISAVEAWDAVLKHHQAFSLPPKILEGIKKHQRRFGNAGWLEFLTEHHIVPVSIEDVEYPEKILELSQPPPILYWQSNCGEMAAVLRKPVLAVVGTRHPTPSGEQTLSRILTRFLRFSNKSVVIASGMMYGIDEVAHRQALLAGSPTVAVLGSGLLWQKTHDPTGMFHAIKEDGGVLMSQFHPEVSPQKGTFVARNSTLAGLCGGVLVGEAHLGSGSRHTVAAAARLQKPIWTVPVSSTHPTAPAVVELVNTHGAKLLINEQPLNAFFNIDTVITKLKKDVVDNPGTQAVITALQSTSHSFDSLAQVSGLIPSKLTEMLVRLELAGTIERRGPEWLLVDMK